MRYIRELQSQTTRDEYATLQWQWISYTKNPNDIINNQILHSVSDQNGSLVIRFVGTSIAKAITKVQPQTHVLLDRSNS